MSRGERTFREVPHCRQHLGIPFCIGRFKTDGALHVDAAGARFPFLIGRFKTKVAIRGGAGIVRFPFLIGRFETCLTGREDGDSGVSFHSS